MITNVNLSTKERYLLEDQKTHEEQCVLKYDNYARLASDSELKMIFKNLSQKESQHLQTINQLLNGQIPSMANQGGSGSQQQGSQQGMQQQSSQSGMQQQSSQQGMQQSSQQGMQQSSQQSQQSYMQKTSSGNLNLSDKDMCIDMLSTEKYISGTYDTAIFEFKDPRIRDVLNHIQKEEQKHGEALFLYMQSKGMY